MLHRFYLATNRGILPGQPDPGPRKRCKMAIQYTFVLLVSAGSFPFLLSILFFSAPLSPFPPFLHLLHLLHLPLLQRVPSIQCTPIISNITVYQPLCTKPSTFGQVSTVDMAKQIDWHRMIRTDSRLRLLAVITTGEGFFVSYSRFYTHTEPRPSENARE